MKKNFQAEIRILGIDPGTATVGWAILAVQKADFQLEAFGCISTSKNNSDAERLREIAKDLEKIINDFHPDEVAIEELFFFKNFKTAISVAQARGVLLFTASNNNCLVFEYTPLQVKQAITGYGRAEKSQIQLMIKNLLKLEKIPQPDDAADAIAVAICHQQSRKISLLN